MFKGNLFIHANEYNYENLQITANTILEIHWRKRFKLRET